MAAILLATACADTKTPGQDRPAGSFGAYPAPEMLASGAVVATVGDVVFTTDELKKRMMGLNSFVRGQLADPAQLRRWVENEIRVEALAQRAWAKGVQNNPEVQARIRAVLVEVVTRQELKASERGLEPNDAELIREYEARHDEFNKPAKIRLSQIVRYVDTKAERAKARKLLTTLRSKVIAGQKRNDHRVFAQAAKEHSQDEATRLGAGDLQYLTRDQLIERYGDGVAKQSFEEAEVGDLYVAEAPNALVLFKMTGRRKAVKRSLEEVRSQLRGVLVQRNRQTQLDAWSRDILEKSGVKIDDAALGTFEIPGVSPPTPPAGTPE